MLTTEVLLQTSKNLETKITQYFHLERKPCHEESIFRFYAYTFIVLSKHTCLM